jgi:hypothetical protein
MFCAVADHWGDRLRAVVGKRHFVDREPGMLLVWLPADESVRRLVTELSPQVEARHLTARCSMRETGAALAWQVVGDEDDLRAIESAYLA